MELLKSLFLATNSRADYSVEEVRGERLAAQRTHPHVIFGAAASTKCLSITVHRNSVLSLTAALTAVDELLKFLSGYP